MAREYATDEIVVEWRPRLCYHSVNCVNALPEEVPRAAFCRCGHSGNKPFCDGSHREVGFRS